MAGGAESRADAMLLCGGVQRCAGGCGRGEGWWRGVSAQKMLRKDVPKSVLKLIVTEFCFHGHTYRNFASFFLASKIRTRSFFPEKENQIVNSKEKPVYLG